VDEKLQPPPPVLEREAVTFWPGGGGELVDDKVPVRRDGYYICGSWSGWQDSTLMKKAKDGELTARIRLGVNRFEKFQIWCDNNAEKALYPDCLNAPMGVKVLGPGPDGDIDDKDLIEDVRGARAPCWMIDGRITQYVAKGGRESIGDASSGILAKTVSSDEVVEVGTEDTGMPGDEYEITLSVSGKWRMVTWKKLPSDDTEPIPDNGTYYVVGNWSGWQTEEMKCEDAAAGVYSCTVTLGGYDSMFHIVRDGDWSQVFHPRDDSVPGELASAGVNGPDDWDTAYNNYFRVGGKGGDQAKITFQRSITSGEMKVSWAIGSAGRPALG